MSSDLHALLRVKRKHLQKAIDTFSRSFINDPLTMHMFPNEEERKEFMRHYFRFRIKYTVVTDAPTITIVEIIIAENIR